MSDENSNGLFFSPEPSTDIWDELAYKASHELKNPLAAFSLQSRMIEYILLDPNILDNKDKIVNILRNTDRQVQRMERILDEMITIIDTRNSPSVSFKR